MQHTLPQSRIKHIAVLMLENRSLDHLFGFFQQRPGQTIENLQGAHATLSNLLDPSQPASTANPHFTVSHPAPFAGCTAPAVCVATQRAAPEDVPSVVEGSKGG